MLLILLYKVVGVLQRRGLLQGLEEGKVEWNQSITAISSSFTGGWLYKIYIPLLGITRNSQIIRQVFASCSRHSVPTPIPSARFMA